MKRLSYSIECKSELNLKFKIFKFKCILSLEKAVTIPLAEQM